MINWNIFNELKRKFWQTKNQDEWNSVKNEYKEMINSYEGNEKELFKTKTIPQIEEVYNKKKQQWNHPTIVKNSFIFREDEGKAFIQLCNALVMHLESVK